LPVITDDEVKSRTALFSADNADPDRHPRYPEISFSGSDLRAKRTHEYQWVHILIYDNKTSAGFLSISGGR
jgi:hypothetical protein